MLINRLNIDYWDISHSQEKLIKMAKFVVALSIFLVVCSGTQGNIVDNVTGWISDKAEEIGENIKAAADDLAHKWTEVSRDADKFVRDTRNNVRKAVDRFEEQTNELMADVQDTSACVSDGGDFGNRAERIGQKVEACAGQSLAELKGSYEDTQEELEVFKSVLAEFKAEAEKCSANKNILICAWEVAKDRRAEIEEQWKSLWTKVTSLGQDFLNYRGTLSECRSTEGYETLVAERDEAVAEIRKCLNGLKKD